MCDLEMNQIADSSATAEKIQKDQVVQADQTFDVDFDPPGILTDPPRTS